MPELSIKDQIKKLVELQKIDGEIYTLKKDLLEKPAELEKLKSQFEKKKTKLADLEEKSKSIQLDRKEKELELKTKEEETTKAKSQLNELKTNKEYSAKISEIENIKADQSVIEEKILLSYEETDAVDSQIDEEKKNVAEEEKKYLNKKREVEPDIKQIDGRIKVLDSQRKQSIGEVDPTLLKNYDKILENKGGMAIVPVQGNSCGGCYMQVTAQMINTIKMRTELVTCGKCSRILYIEDDL